MKQGNLESDQTPDFVCFRKVVYDKDKTSNIVCFRKKLDFREKKSDFREKIRDFVFPGMFHNKIFFLKL